MCIITNRFVVKAKKHMSSLEFRPQTTEEFNLETLKSIVTKQMFMVNIFEDIYNIGLHYLWVAKHWKKILKAQKTNKWNYGNYFESEIKKNKNMFINLCISTNMFNRQIDSFYVDDNDNIVHEVIDKKSKKEKLLKNVEIVQFSNMSSALFEKSYLKTLRSKYKADEKKALAKITNIPLNYKKGGTYICVVTLKNENIAKSSLVKTATGEINKEISRNIAINLSSVVIVNSILYLSSMRSPYHFGK